MSNNNSLMIVTEIPIFKSFTLDPGVHSNQSDMLCIYISLQVLVFYNAKEDVLYCCEVWKNVQ